jgi:hypothetical protein
MLVIYSNSVKMNSMTHFEIWVSRESEVGAACLYCGDVPKVGTLLNGSEVRLVVPQPNNPKQFLAILAR